MKKRSLSTSAAIITSAVASASGQAQTNAPWAPDPQELGITPEIAAYHRGFSEGQTTGYGFGQAMGLKAGRAAGFEKGEISGMKKTLAGVAAAGVAIAGVGTCGYRAVVRRRRKREEEVQVSDVPVVR